MRYQVQMSFFDIQKRLNAIFLHHKKVIKYAHCFALVFPSTAFMELPTQRSGWDLSWHGEEGNQETMAGQGSPGEEKTTWIWQSWTRSASSIAMPDCCSCWHIWPVHHLQLHLSPRAENKHLLGDKDGSMCQQRTSQWGWYEVPFNLKWLTGHTNSLYCGQVEHEFASVDLNYPKLWAWYNVLLIFFFMKPTDMFFLSGKMNTLPPNSIIVAMVEKVCKPWWYCKRAFLKACIISFTATFLHVNYQYKLAHAVPIRVECIKMKSPVHVGRILSQQSHKCVMVL